MQDKSELHPTITEKDGEPDIRAVNGIGVIFIQLGIPLNHSTHPDLGEIRDGITGISDLQVHNVEKMTLLMQCEGITDKEELTILFNQCAADLNHWFSQLNKDQRKIATEVLDSTETAYVYSESGVNQKRGLDYGPGD